MTQTTNKKLRNKENEQKKKAINENAYKQTKCDVNIPAAVETAETQTQQRWQDCIGTAIVEKKNFFANFGSLDLRCDYDLAVKNDQGGDVGFFRVMSLTLVECYPPLRWGGQVGPLSHSLFCSQITLLTLVSQPWWWFPQPSKSDYLSLTVRLGHNLEKFSAPTCAGPLPMSQTRTTARPMDGFELQSWRSLTESVGGRGYCCSAARRREEEGETYVTTKQNKTLPKPYSATQKICHSFFSSAAGEPRLLQEADLEVGSRLLPDDPEVAWSLRRCFFFLPVFSSAFCFPPIFSLPSEFLFIVPIELI